MDNAENAPLISHHSAVAARVPIDNTSEVWSLCAVVSFSREDNAYEVVDIMEHTERNPAHYLVPREKVIEFPQPNLEPRSLTPLDVSNPAPSKILALWYDSEPTGGEAPPPNSWTPLFSSVFYDCYVLALPDADEPEAETVLVRFAGTPFEELLPSHYLLVPPLSESEYDELPASIKLL